MIYGPYTAKDSLGNTIAVFNCIKDAIKFYQDSLEKMVVFDRDNNDITDLLDILDNF